MAKKRFWESVFGKQYAPSKHSKPLFMERRLDNFNTTDKHGRIPFFDPAIVTYPIKRFPQGEPESIPYQPVSVNLPNIVVGALGLSQHIIEPPPGIMWQLLFITVRHDDAGAHFFNVGLNAPVGVLFTEEDHINTPANLWTPIFPYFHELGVQGAFHQVGYWPLYLDNYHADNQEVVVAGNGLAIGTIVEVQHIYNRII